MNEPKTGRADAKQRTRARLVDVARRLFERAGYEGTTLRQVAEAAEVAVGTVFVHFQDKSALLAATLEQQIAPALDRPKASAASRSPRERIRALVVDLYRSYTRNPQLARVLVRESLFLEGEGRSPSDRRLAEFRDTLIAICAEPGAVGKGRRPEAAAHAVLAAYFYCLFDGLRRESFDLRRQMRLFDLLIGPWFPVEKRSRR